MLYRRIRAEISLNIREFESPNKQELGGARHCSIAVGGRLEDPPTSNALVEGTSMYKKIVNLNTMVAVVAIGGASLLATPQQASAQGPSGSYRNSCRSISMDRGGYLEAQCRTTNGIWRQSRIRVAECRGRDIANRNGRLVCADGQRGNGRGKSDWDGWGRHDDDRRDGRDWDRGRDDRGRDDRSQGRGRNDDWNRNRDRDSRNNQSGLILYDGTGWSGRRMPIRTDYSNLEKTGFNDVASSIRITGRGTWRFCSDKNYGGRCIDVSSNVRDLRTFVMHNRISSIRRIS